MVSSNIFGDPRSRKDRIERIRNREIDQPAAYDLGTQPPSLLALLLFLDNSKDSLARVLFFKVKPTNDSRSRVHKSDPVSNSDLERLDLFPNPISGVDDELSELQRSVHLEDVDKSGELGRVRRVQAEVGLYKLDVILAQ